MSKDGYDPKYDIEHIRWDFTKVHKSHADPLEEHMQYYTSSEKPWMYSIQDFLKKEPTLNNMQRMIEYADEFLLVETKNMKWWDDLKDLYVQKDDLKSERQRANPYEKVKLSFKINRITKEIEKHGNSYSENVFREKYDLIADEHPEILLYAENVRVRMTVGIEMWRHAAVREVSAKYLDLQETEAGREIAPFLKQVNEEYGRDLTRKEIEQLYENEPSPKFKRLKDAFYKADQEKKLFLTKASPEPTSENAEQQINQKKTMKQSLEVTQQQSQKQKRRIQDEQRRF